MKIKNTILFSLIATFFLIFLVSIWKVLATLQGLTIKTFTIEIIFIIGFLISLFHLIFNDKIKHIYNKLTLCSFFELSVQILNYKLFYYIYNQHNYL